MAPHDQHWVVTGLKVASTRTPDLSGCWVPAILQFGGAEAPYFICRPYRGSVCRTSIAAAARASRSGRSRYWLRVRGLLRERASAAARLLGVRVLEHEALMHQGLFVVENHSMQVDERFRIDEYSHVVELKNAIAFTRMRIEADVVAEPRTSAALHAQSQAAFRRRNVLFGHGGANAHQGFVRYLDALRRRWWRLRRIFNVDRAHRFFGVSSFAARHIGLRF